MQHQTVNHRSRGSPFVPIQSGGHGGPAAVASSFEGQIARLFRRLGYRVRRRLATHDSGVDLDLARPGLRAIVQCKHWRHPVGPAVIRDLYGTLLHTGADLGILATTSTISQSARSFAQGKPLLLLDGAILQLLLPNSS
jgi:restriction system protein